MRTTAVVAAAIVATNRTRGSRPPYEAGANLLAIAGVVPVALALPSSERQGGEDMQFGYSSASKSAPRRPKKGPVFCVGWHAFVNWPQPAGTTPPPVPMIDGDGKPMANDLLDGQEVEIASWRPRAREGVAYQVRRSADGSEWWIAVEYLRRLRQAPPIVKTPA